MAGKTKPGIPVKGINIKLRMINDLMDVTGSAKDSWNPAEISDDMKAIAYIHDLADTWNPAQLNEALKYLGFATIDSWNPAIIEETKNKLVKYFLPTNASGNPIELDLKGAFPYEATSLTIDLLPIQDLHGYDSPWAAGGGKNLLFAGAVNETRSGITFTAIGDGSSFIVSGTAEANVTLTILTGAKATNKLKSGVTYTFSGGHWADIGVAYIQLVYKGDTTGKTISIVSINGATTITPSEDATLDGIYLSFRQGNTFNNDLVQPQFEVGSSASSFAPYSNICPISGRNSVTLTVNGDDTEITFEDTVYGGTVNVIEGGTSSIYGYIASYDGEELPGAWISDRDAYAAGTEPTTGAEVAYILATPTELTTPANEIDPVNGENTLSTDGDNINITYKAILNS